jgi:hypothetical protein
MINYPKTQEEKVAFFAALKNQSSSQPMLMTMSVEETPRSINKARIQTKLDELNARDAAKANP